MTSRRTGRTFTHELTDAGWRWCTVALTAGLPAKASSAEGALHVVLAGIARYLDNTGQSLADVFGWQIEDLIKTAYRSLAAVPGDFVKIRELRAQLPDIPHGDLDVTLEKLYRSQRVNLVPQSNQEALTQADQEAALRIGGRGQAHDFD